MNYMTKIDAARTRRGISVRKLANNAGLSYKTVENLFSGKNRNPQIETVTSICDALEISVASVFTTENEVVISARAEDAALFEAAIKTPAEFRVILFELLRYIMK